MIQVLKKLRVPEYLQRMIETYLKDKVLAYETTNETRRNDITVGDAQVSILGPALCNISYDDILHPQI